MRLLKTRRKEKGRLGGTATRTNSFVVVLYFVLLGLQTPNFVAMWTTLSTRLRLLGSMSSVRDLFFLNGTAEAIISSVRDFSYLNGTAEERYQNKTIAFIFAGRQDRLEIQILYLEELVNAGEVDYVHYFHCGPSPEDSAWLHKLADVLPPWFELRMTDPPCGPNYFCAVFDVYRYEIYKTSNFVKIDDDIVALPRNGALTRMIEYNMGVHLHAWWTSALVLNNPLVDHYLQTIDGVIPLDNALNFTELPQEGDILGVPTVEQYSRHRASLSALHQLYVSNATLFDHLDGVYIVPPGYRVGLNFMVFSYTQLVRWNLPPIHGFDELILARKSSEYQLNQSVQIFKGAPAVHLSYGRQHRAWMYDPRVLPPYLELACKRTQAPNSEDVDGTFVARVLALCRYRDFWS